MFKKIVKVWLVTIPLILLALVLAIIGFVIIKISTPCVWFGDSCLSATDSILTKAIKGSGVDLS